MARVHATPACDNERSGSLDARRPDSLLIVLVGLPGSGKSTIGKLLARRLNVDFVDSDQIVERTLGCSIASYFQTAGEEAFRDCEQDVIDALMRGGPSVVATGGGAVLRSENRRAFAESAAQVVYLQVSFNDLVQRLGKDHRRPMFQHGNTEHRLRQLINAREPLYESVATLTVTCRGNSPRAIAARIVEATGTCRRARPARPPSADPPDVATTPRLSGPIQSDLVDP